MELEITISGNDGYGGVHICLGSGNTIQGNYIGTDVTGTVDLGNRHHGVYFSKTMDNLLGGTEAGARNVISGNNNVGVFVYSGSGNTIQGNYVGADLTGAVDLGNGSYGVLLNNTTDNTIGGSEAGGGNVISGNDAAGVLVYSGIGSAIRGNLISANTGLGIDLYSNGVAPNDPGDADTGANNLQNFPILASVLTDESTTVIRGTLDSTPNTQPSSLISTPTSKSTRPATAKAKSTSAIWKPRPTNSARQRSQ